MYVCNKLAVAAASKLKYTFLRSKAFLFWEICIMQNWPENNNNNNNVHRYP
jgi:hypothetical protein